MVTQTHVPESLLPHWGWGLDVLSVCLGEISRAERQLLGGDDGGAHFIEFQPLVLINHSLN